jgi:hypothetical protein
MPHEALKDIPQDTFRLVGCILPDWKLPERKKDFNFFPVSDLADKNRALKLADINNLHQVRSTNVVVYVFDHNGNYVHGG